MILNPNADFPVITCHTSLVLTVFYSPGKQHEVRAEGDVILCRKSRSSARARAVLLFWKLDLI